MFRPHPVARLLQAAYLQLPAPPAATQLLPDSTRSYAQVAASYLEFVAQHEWALAMEDLAELAAALTPVPPLFWELLAEVARRLKLPAEAAAYEQQLRQARAN
ncbi:hypothetical protein [Hymenobacter sp. CRA2]|uniref:hypothetical protein n=1 Tax=Hymenobacter sp. CRA2 TaxID=1955620 RepID=UPI001116E896|nr:hypothetical protein [Hymenobacter sp. CRA2]